MENNKTHFIQSKSSKIAEILLFSFFGILAILIADHYIFNPFILVIIFLSYNRGINTYLITTFLMILSALMINIYYGIEIVIINLFFFLFCVILCFLKNQFFIKKFGAFFLTNILFALLHIIKNFSIHATINVLLSFLISCLLLYGFFEFMKCIFEPSRPFEKKAKLIVLSTFPLLFFGVEGFYIFFVCLTHLLICKTVSMIEGALSIVLNCFIIYYVQGASYTDFIILLVPALISVFINKKYSSTIYLISFTFLSIYLIKNFYQTGLFYQGITASLTSFLIPTNLVDKLGNIFERDDDKLFIERDLKLKHSQENINNIIQYLDVVLDGSIDSTTSPVDKMVDLIKEKVCFNCERKHLCQLGSIIRKGLEEELLKDDKKIIFDDCLYPYKLIRNLRIKKASLINEKKYLDEIHQKNEAYKKEIENIYKPLRNICLKINDSLYQEMKIIQKLEEENFEIDDLILGNNKLSFNIYLENKDEVKKVIDIISSILKKSFYLEDMFFILSLGLYQVSLVSLPLFKIEEGIISLGINQEFNGDSYMSFIENNHFFLMLADGIGHQKISSNVSLFTINALNRYRKIEEDMSLQINNLNTLLKSKIDEDGYSTLDYLDIDLITGEFKIFKCGSFYSYIFSQGKLFQLKSNTPPLGILYDIKTNSLIKQLSSQDILILMSDGFGEYIQESLKNVLNMHSNRSSKDICGVLYDELSKHINRKDDITIIVIKILQIKDFRRE